MFMFTVDPIDDDCFDLYLSDDDGYTWEFYNWYDSFVLAYTTGQDIVREMVESNWRFSDVA